MPVFDHDLQNNGIQLKEDIGIVWNSSRVGLEGYHDNGTRIK